MIKKKWPFWIKLLLAPIAMIGALITLPVAVVLIFADFDKCEALMDFWTEQE